MKVSDYIIKFFEEKEIDTIFGYLGGMITHLADSIGTNKNVRFIQTYHEQTAAIAIEGWARETGKPGVAMATSGPGATNMVTGIADAYLDSIPGIYITGQVNTYEYKYDKPIRQLGFQEMDVVSMVKDITKYSVMIVDEKKIRYELEKAYYMATEGRKGPVLLDIPMNIQRAEIAPNLLESFIPENKIEEKISLEKIYDLINKSEKPLLLVGGGCLSLESKKEIKKFVEKNKIPVVSSLMGRGTLDETKEEYIGMIGSYGNRCANMITASSDLLIAVGTRLDTRQTGAMVGEFLKNGKIIHIDIDDNELNFHRIERKINIKMKSEDFFRNLNKDNIINKKRENWIKFYEELKEKYNQNNEIKYNIKNKSPYRLIEILNNLSKENEVFIGDIGQNQMWTAQSLVLKNNQKFFTSGGLAPMGYSIPCAVGVAFAKNNDVNVYSICGDGGFHMSLQSLMLISQYNLPIKVIVMNNSALGMITQFQELYFNSRMTGTTEEGGYKVPNLDKIAAAYNLKYYELREKDLTDKKLIEEIINTRNCIVNYIIEGSTKVYPKLEYDSPIENPSPKLEIKELEKWIMQN